MNNEEKSSLIAKRLAQMKGASPAPVPPKPEAKPAIPPTPVKPAPQAKGTEYRKAARVEEKPDNFSKRYSLILLIGIPALIIFSLSGLYFVFASRIVPEQQPEQVAPPEFSLQADASPQASSEPASPSVSNKEQEYADYARSISGKEDPMAPADIPVYEEPPVIAAPPVKISVSLLGTVLDEPKVALLEVTKPSGEKKKFKAREGSSAEGLIVQKIDNNSVTLTDSRELYQVNLGSSTEITRDGSPAAQVRSTVPR